MKLRHYRFVFPFFVLLIAPRLASADEGMWTFDNPPLTQWAEKYNFTPDQAWLDHVRLASLRFNNGGSGSFVSKGGLVLTNHHVARGQIQKLSTPDNDLVANGFYATSLEEELPCPDLELNQLISMENVTDRIQAAVADIIEPAEAIKKRRAVIAEIEKESMDATGLRSDVVALYGGGEYWLYRYKRFTDVRLVWAPEGQAAFFGGDLDNFTYPRHDLDATFLRVYENNEPYHPDHYFTWSESGAEEDELVLVIGNPGSTNRLHTLAQLGYQRDYLYHLTIEYINQLLGWYREYAAQGDEPARQALNNIFGLENALKVRTGEFEGLMNPDIMAKKDQEEEDFRKRIMDNRRLAEEYGEIWSIIEGVVEKEKTTLKESYYREISGNLFRYALTIVRYVEEIPKPDAERYPGFHDSELPSLKFRLFSPAPTYPEMEEYVAGKFLDQAKEVLGKNDPFIKTAMGRKSGSNVAQKLFDGTRMTDVEYRRELVDGGKEAVTKSKDPLIVLARKLDPLFREMHEWREENISGVLTPALEKLGRARFDVFGKSKNPDATFTLRISYGPAASYIMGTTVVPYKTTFFGLYDRATSMGNKSPFNLAPRWVGKDKQLDLSTPVNFVCTADIIGGNSGSPM
ncbi:MAG: S46 family peptidase, partial [Candidatus Neomarinimicrobiota bacterium]